MDFQSSRIQPSKKIKIEDDVKQEDLEAAAACGDDFLKEAHEDILLEIFIRLPDSRSAIRTATVCHKWHSVISHNPRFIARFISHHRQHQHRYPLPYTIFFSKAEYNPDFSEFAGPQYFQPVCKLFSDQESTFCTSPEFLDFIMPSSPMVIRGSWNDLLLVSHGPRESTHLYICNPITKQFIQLPEVPRSKHPGFEHVAGHALVCMPGPTNKSRFKVVEFTKPIYPKYDSELPRNTVQPIMLFCSESRKWEPRHFRYPRPTIRYGTKWLHGVAYNEILYWLECPDFGANRVIYSDLINDQCGAIDSPDDYSHDLLNARDQIGVVRVRGVEELRLLQVLTFDFESTVDLKVWKLSRNDHSDKKEWALVHHKKELKRPPGRFFKAQPFVHPTNGDVVLMVWGQKIFQYDLKDTNSSTYELIGKLQKPLAKFRVGDWEEPSVLQFPVVHTFWPTQILTS